MPCTPPTLVGFGINKWNVLGFQHASYVYTNLATLTGETFKGYYTDPTVDINSELRWANTLSPSSATPYIGCPITIDNHTIAYKRQGFPDAFYQIDLNAHDNGVQCYVNSVLVYQIDGCCADRSVIWSGRLCSTSTVEFRVMESNNASNLKVDFIDMPFAAGTINGTQTICSNSTTLLSKSGNPSGSWTTSNAAVATVNSSTGLVSAISAGSATITYTVNGGTCGNASATIPINVITPTNAGVLSGIEMACVGATTTFTSNGTAGGIWSSSDPGIANVNSSTSLITGIAAGPATITYTVLGVGGCPNATAISSVAISATPSVNAGNDVAICAGLSTQLSGSGGQIGTLTININGYNMDETTWSLSNSLGTVMISGSGFFETTQNYNYSPSSSDGPFTFTINTQGFFNDNTANYSIYCNGSSIFSGSIGGGQNVIQSIATCQTAASLSWSPPTNLSSTTVSNPTCSATIATTYTLTATHNGCSSTDQVEVSMRTIPPAPSVSVSPSIICPGNTTQLSIGGLAPSGQAFKGNGLNSYIKV